MGDLNDYSLKPKFELRKSLTSLFLPIAVYLKAV